MIMFCVLDILAKKSLFLIIEMYVYRFFSVLYYTRV